MTPPVPYEIYTSIASKFVHTTADSSVVFSCNRPPGGSTADRIFRIMIRDIKI